MKARTLLIWLLIAMIPLVIAASFPDGFTRYEYYNQNPDNLEWIDSSSDGQSWQTFTVGNVSTNTDLTVKGAQIEFTSCDSAGAITVYYNIFDAANRTTIYKNWSMGKGETGLTNPAGWVNLTFSENASLTAGGVYALHINTSASNNGCGWRSDRSSPGYDGGLTGNDDSLPEADAMFEIWGEPAYAILVSLNTPTTSSSTISETEDFNISYSAVDVDGLTNATFYLWNSSSSIINQTFREITGTVNETIINDVPLPQLENFEWNVYACGENATGTLCNFAVANYTLTKGAFTENGQDFESQVWDTDNSTFNLNITVDANAELFTSSLIYNGTSYPATAINTGNGNYTLTRKIDIHPQKSNGNVSFFWRLTLDVGTGFTSQNSTEKSHVVNRTSYNITTTNSALNISFYDEDTLAPIFSKFESEFVWYLGDGTQTRNISFGLNNSLHNVTFGINPGDEAFYTSYYFEIINSSDEFLYLNRIYEFNDEKLTNTMKNKPLYLLNNTKGSNINIRVRDQSLNPLENYNVRISRYYPDEGVYRIVESRNTDSFGQFVAKLIENNVKYKFEFYDSEGILRETEDDVYIICTSSICYKDFVIETAGEDFDRFFNLTDYDWTLTYNNETKTFRFTWDDDRGENAVHRFEIRLIQFNGTTYVFNDTSTADEGSLTYTATIDGTYTAQPFRTANGVTRKIAVLDVKVGGVSQIFGLEGVIWGIILLLTLVSIGIWSPPVGIMLYIGGWIVLAVTQIVHVSLPIFFANLIIGALFIWAFKT